MKEGGDTDTNACIAGGMIGALIGFKNIPKDITSKVLDFDCTQEMGEDLGVKRPEYLSVKKHAMTNIKKLIQIRPK